MAPKTAAAPPMSDFMSSMPWAGLIEMPPVSKQTPLPTRARGASSPPPRQRMIATKGGWALPCATPSRAFMPRRVELGAIEDLDLDAHVGEAGAGVGEGLGGEHVAGLGDEVAGAADRLGQRAGAGDRRLGSIHRHRKALRAAILLILPVAGAVLREPVGAQCRTQGQGGRGIGGRQRQVQAGGRDQRRLAHLQRAQLLRQRAAGLLQVQPADAVGLAEREKDDPVQAQARRQEQLHAPAVLEAALDRGQGPAEQPVAHLVESRGGRGQGPVVTDRDDHGAAFGQPCRLGQDLHPRPPLRT